MKKNIEDCFYEGRVYSKLEIDKNGHEEKEFFLVDDEGTAFYRIEEFKYMHSDLRFTVSKAVSRLSPSKHIEVPKKKLNVVEVIRHIRGVDENNFDIAARGGMTVICHLNYTTMIMKVYPAFCSESDNYNKREGIYWARRSQNEDLGFVVKFDELSSWNTIVSVIFMKKPIWLNEASKTKFEKHLNRIKGLIHD